MCPNLDPESETGSVFGGLAESKIWRVSPGVVQDETGSNSWIWSITTESWTGGYPDKQILASNYESIRYIATVKKEKKCGENRDELRWVL